MTTLPTPSREFTKSWTRPPYPSDEQARNYRQSCVSQAIDPAHAVGFAPVTAPEVTETSGGITVKFGAVRTSALDPDQRAASSALREGWTLSA